MIKGIINILISDASVQTLVGRNAADDKYKVFPVVASQDEKAPYIVVRSNGHQLAAKGLLNYSLDVIVFSYHTSYDEVTALDEAACLALVSAGSNTYNGIQIDFINPSNLGVDGYVQDHGGLFTKSSTFNCMIKS